MSWSNTGNANDGTSCDKSGHNACQTGAPNSPTDTNRTYVFASNGYPPCTQLEVRTYARTCVHVFVCGVRACVRVCVCAGVRGGGRAGGRVCVCACVCVEYDDKPIR